MFYHKKIQKRMKLYKGELIIFFVSGKDAKVYNGVGEVRYKGE